MTLFPLWDYVMLEEIKKENNPMTLDLPEEDSSNWGLVIRSAVPEIPIGCKVVFKRHLFEKVEYRGKEILLGKKENIIAKCDCSHEVDPK